MTDPYADDFFASMFSDKIAAAPPPPASQGASLQVRLDNVFVIAPTHQPNTSKKVTITKVLVMTNEYTVFSRARIDSRTGFLHAEALDRDTKARAGEKVIRDGLALTLVQMGKVMEDLEMGRFYSIDLSEVSVSHFGGSDSIEARAIAIRPAFGAKAPLHYLELGGDKAGWFMAMMLKSVYINTPKICHASLKHPAAGTTAPVPALENDQASDSAAVDPFQPASPSGVGNLSKASGAVMSSSSSLSTQSAQAAANPLVPAADAKDAKDTKERQKVPRSEISPDSVHMFNATWILPLIANLSHEAQKIMMRNCEPALMLNAPDSGPGSWPGLYPDLQNQNAYKIRNFRRSNLTGHQMGVKDMKTPLNKIVPPFALGGVAYHRPPTPFSVEITLWTSSILAYGMLDNQLLWHLRSLLSNTPTFAIGYLEPNPKLIRDYVPAPTSAVYLNMHTNGHGKGVTGAPTGIPPGAVALLPFGIVYSGYRIDQDSVIAILAQLGSKQKGRYAPNMHDARTRFQYDPTCTTPTKRVPLSPTFLEMLAPDDEGPVVINCLESTRDFTSAALGDVYEFYAVPECGEKRAACGRPDLDSEGLKYYRDVVADKGLDAADKLFGSIFLNVAKGARNFEPHLAAGIFAPAPDHKGEPPAPPTVGLFAVRKDYIRDAGLDPLNLDRHNELIKAEFEKMYPCTETAALDELERCFGPLDPAQKQALTLQYKEHGLPLVAPVDSDMNNSSSSKRARTPDYQSDAGDEDVHNDKRRCTSDGGDE